MKRLIAVLLVFLTITSFSFAHNTEDEGFPSYGALTASLEIGRGELITENLKENYEEYFGELSFDGVTFFNKDKDNLVGLGYGLGFILPQMLNVIDKENGDIVPFGGIGRISFEYSRRLIDSFYMEFRAGLGIKYLIISGFAVKDEIGSQNLENLELYLLGGLGFVYEFSNNIGLRFGCDFNYTVFSNIEADFRHKAEEKERIKEMSSYSFQPYIGVAFLY